MPKVLLAIVIPILDSLYNKIAVWLNDMGKSFEVVSNATHLNIVNEKKPPCVKQTIWDILQKITNWSPIMKTS